MTQFAHPQGVLATAGKSAGKFVGADGETPTVAQPEILPLIAGFLPLISAALLASTGNLYAGLMYPIVVAVLTVIIGGLFLRETRHVLIWDEVGGETENVRAAASGG
jgi:hypothetical protein